MVAMLLKCSLTCAALVDRAMHGAMEGPGNVLLIQELHKAVHVQVVAAGSGEDVAIGIQDEVVGLGVHAEAGLGDVGVHPAHILEHFPALGCNPFVLR